jgi:pyrimidine operon attenuation protein / uracil phosphoribosyltransferase
MNRLLTAQQIRHAISRLYDAIAEAIPRDGRVAVIGIRTRGETLAARIVDQLRRDFPGRQFDHGVLDITFYRDDLAMRRGAPLVRATEIDFDLDDAFVVLIDDVLHTGRSIRAALDALHDFGRPTVVRLGVLIDRGGRELPIAADFVGRKLQAPDNKRVQVKLKENDGEEGVFIISRR